MCTFDDSGFHFLCALSAVGDGALVICFDMLLLFSSFAKLFDGTLKVDGCVG